MAISVRCLRTAMQPRLFIFLKRLAGGLAWLCGGYRTYWLYRRNAYLVSAYAGWPYRGVKLKLAAAHHLLLSIFGESAIILSGYAYVNGWLAAAYGWRNAMSAGFQKRSGASSLAKPRESDHGLRLAK